MGCGQSKTPINAASSSLENKPGTAQDGQRGRRRKNDYHRDPTRSTTEEDRDYFGGCPSSPQPADMGSRGGVLVAQYDFEPRRKGDLAFRKGDQLELMPTGHYRDHSWVLARRTTQSGLQGYIPRNYVTKKKTDDTRDCLESQEWYFGKLTRIDAEKALSSPHLTAGTFLVRVSGTSHNSLALSVRSRRVPLTGQINIVHYKIERKSDGSCNFASHRAFPSCVALIEHCRVTGQGLTQKLMTVCPKATLTKMTPLRQSLDNWEVDRNYLTFDQKLGAGQFGEVWQGQYKNRVQVAIKTLKPGSMCPQKFLEEALLMKDCRHERLVTLYAVCSLAQPFYIITELMVHGSLLQFLRLGPGGDLSVVILVDMASQVASGMWYLERHGYIHRDLAARNVLVGESLVVKVADFGLARAIVDGEYNPQEGAKFPIKWTAPEAALYGKFSIKSDVWSFGILLHELLTRGQTPYPGMNNREVLEQMNMGYRMPQSALVPDNVYGKMLQCWDKEAARRPTFHHLHEFFDDYFVYTEDHYKAE